MKRSLLALAVAIPVLLSGGMSAAERTTDNVLFNRFHDYLETLRVQADIPGLAATVVSSSDVLWEHGFGVRDVDRNLPVFADTPFQLDGITQTVVASLILRCADGGWVSLDDRVARYDPTSPDAGLTLRMLLSHTSPGPNGLTFAYRLDRLGPLAPAVAACTDSSFRYGIAGLLERMGMFDSVPGADTVELTPEAERFDAPTLQRYKDVLERLAVPYAVDGKGRPSRSVYAATSLTPAGGLITTVRDLAKLDLALKDGIVMRPETLAAAWTAPIDLKGQPLPHGLGWFVQSYNGEPIVWQFGVSENASSSLIVTAPRRGLTLIMLANSSGLAQNLALAAGDVRVSPFAKLFLGLFLR